MLKDEIFNYLHHTPGVYQVKDLAVQFNCYAGTVGKVLYKLQQLGRAESRRVGNAYTWTVCASPDKVTDWECWPDPMEWVSEV